MRGALSAFHSFEKYNYKTSSRMVADFLAAVACAFAFAAFFLALRCFRAIDVFFLARVFCARLM
jgi:hypothetical protein